MWLLEIGLLFSRINIIYTWKGSKRRNSFSLGQVELIFKGFFRA